MGLNIIEKFSKVKEYLKAKKSQIIAIGDNRSVVNYVLCANGALIVGLGLIATFINQDAIKRYVDIRSSVGRMKEISESYELYLTRAQVTLHPNQKELKKIGDKLENEKKKITSLHAELHDPEFSDHVKEFINILDKRLAVRDELINRYNILFEVYDDYRKAAKKAELALRDNNKLQIQAKHIMLDLENVRLMAQMDNRNDILTKIRLFRSELLHESPRIQSAGALFSERTEDIVKLLRYLDTIRTSMKSDGYTQTLDMLESGTHDKISVEELKFKAKLFTLFLIGFVIAAFQIIILTWFFIGRRRSDKITQQANESMAKSKQIVARAKQYALDAQRGQYKLLKHFCGDFSNIITNISNTSKAIKETKEVSTRFFESHTNTLSASVEALEAWLGNYLEIHIAREEWRDPSDEALNPEEIVSTLFAQARFYAGDREHEMAMFFEKIPKGLKGDIEYIRSIYMNMVYIVLKWSDKSWVKTSIQFEPPKTEEGAEEPIEGEEAAVPKGTLIITVIDSSDSEDFTNRQALFNRDGAGEDEVDAADRFVTAALYYSRQIGDLLNAKFDLTRTVAEENVFKVEIPVSVTAEEAEEEVGVPLLQNKSAIIVSPFSNILHTTTDQIKLFGMNVSSISDKFAAIGRIVEAQQSGENFDIIILDHRPPEIDAIMLAKVVRENTISGLVHIIVLTTEGYLASLEDSKTDIDAILTKPICPTELNEVINKFIEIQLYGIPDDGQEEFNDEEQEETKRFLAIMNEDLSSSLITLIVTRQNYHIDIATTASQVMESLDSHHYDFILVSDKGTWLVPDNVIKDIRRHHTDNKDSVVIMLYDEMDPSDHQKYIKAGFDDFIEVPLNKNVFLSKVEEWEDPIARRMEPVDGLEKSAEDVSGEASDVEGEPNISDDDANTAS